MVQLILIQACVQQYEHLTSVVLGTTFVPYGAKERIR
jgi:hypothetical protein